MSPAKTPTENPRGKTTGKDKPVIATLRGSTEFKGFLERAARLDRSAVSHYLERAAIHYARHLGLTEEAPDR